MFQHNFFFSSLNGQLASKIAASFIKHSTIAALGTHIFIYFYHSLKLNLLLKHENFDGLVWDEAMGGLLLRPSLHISITESQLVEPDLHRLSMIITLIINENCYFWKMKNFHLSTSSSLVVMMRYAMRVSVLLSKEFKFHHHLAISFSVLES